MRHFLPHKKKNNFVILDDFFPNLISGFRIAEYNSYFSKYPNLKVYSSCENFAAVLAEYEAQFPEWKGRTRPYDPAALKTAGMAYINFLNNAYYFLPDLEATQTPFILNLYPGGGFGLNEPSSDIRLDRVIHSGLCEHLITTQNVSRDYVLSRRFQDIRISLIYGVVINPSFFSKDPQNRTYFPTKPTLDVGFVAMRYMKHGENKGFPEFCKAAAKLSSDQNLSWHIVGNFTDSNWPTNLPRPQSLHFHGVLYTEQLRTLSRQLDVIISPNQPFLLHSGNFDGFPTAACTEAALEGTVIICSDVLNMNLSYENERDIIIIPPTPKAITDALVKLKNAPNLIASIGRSGQIKSHELYHPRIQISRRCEIIESIALKTKSTL